MSFRRVVSLIHAALLFGLCAGPLVACAAPARWEAEIAAFEADDRAHPDRKGGVLFYGSSSIRMWEDLAQDFAGIAVANRGFGGCEMEDLVVHAQRAVIPRAPERIVVYAGDNDLNAGKLPERVLADFEALVRQLHAALPDVRIAFVSIKPSPSRWHLAPEMREANQLVRLFISTDPRLTYVDVFTPMLGADGRPRARLFLADQLHMNAQGYQLWRLALTPFVRNEADSASVPAVPDAFLDDLQERTFRWFWDLAHPRTWLTPDRWPTRSFASVAASGFALTAYGIGAQRGWVTREQARRRVLDTLRFFWTAPQGDAPTGTIGTHGFFYHFLHPDTGTRFRDVELSTVDTALLLAGAMFCQSYFDQAQAQEDSIRTVAEALLNRVEWRWAQVRPPAIGHGWDPEHGFLEWDWSGYNEAMLVYIMAMGSSTNAVDPSAWSAWTRGYHWGTYHGQEHLGFGPLFGHQFSHVWLDLRGIRDAFMREHDLDYFENSRRATLAQHAYAVANPHGWVGYGDTLWGLTACDGPISGTFVVNGRERVFNTYWARGAWIYGEDDDGTICPAAAAGSIAFAPELVTPTLLAMRNAFGERAYSTYGFVDALNPTFTLDTQPQHGRVHAGVGWFDTDYIGIDQGPIVTMIENHRSGLVWKTLRRNAHIVRGLRAAGFTGGWLDSLGTRP